MEPLRVLLVEDNPDVLRYLSWVLRWGGHVVVEASRMDAALQAGRSEPFDLLISDLDLPDGCGLDLLRELRDDRPPAAIALSGYGSIEDIRESRRAGFAIHLVKPIDFASLQAAITEVSAVGVLAAAEVEA